MKEEELKVMSDAEGIFWLTIVGIVLTLLGYIVGPWLWVGFRWLQLYFDWVVKTFSPS